MSTFNEFLSGTSRFASSAFTGIKGAFTSAAEKYPVAMKWATFGFAALLSYTAGKSVLGFLFKAVGMDPNSGIAGVLALTLAAAGAVYAASAAGDWVANKNPNNRATEGPDATRNGTNVNAVTQMVGATPSGP